MEFILALIVIFAALLWFYFLKALWSDDSHSDCSSHNPKTYTSSTEFKTTITTAFDEKDKITTTFTTKF